MADYAQDDGIRVIIVQGAGGKSFVSGADISEFDEKRSSPETTAAYHEVSLRATVALRTINKPIIAMVKGYCIGGVSVALSCDIRLAAETARFGIPAAKLGLGL